MSNPETRQVFEGSGEAPKNRIQQVLENIRRMLEKIAQQKKEREQAPKSPKISNEVKKLIENRPTAAENRELYEKVNPIANKREKNAFFGGERVDKQTLEKIEAKRQEKLDPDGERGGTVVDIVDQARESQKKRLSGKQRMDARNAHYVEELLEVDENKLRSEDQNEKEAEQQKLIRAAEGFTTVALTTSETSETAREARDYLREIADEYGEDIPELSELRDATVPKGILYGVEVPTDTKDDIKDLAQEIDEASKNDEVLTETYLANRKKLLEREKRSLNDADKEVVQNIIDRIDDEVEEIQAREPLLQVQEDNLQAERERNSDEIFGRYNQLYLHPTLGKDLIEKPDWAIEELNRQAFEDASTLGGIDEKTTEQKVSIAYGYIRDRAYEEHAGVYFDKYMDGVPADKRPIKFEGNKDEFIDYIKARYRTIAKKINSRYGVQNLDVYLRFNGEPENIAKSVPGVGLGSVGFTMNENGGLVGLVMNRLDLNAQNAVYGPDGNLRYVNATVRNETFEKTVDEIFEEITLYGDKYKEEFGLESVNDITKKDIEHIARLGEALRRITQRGAVTTSHGLAPGMEEHSDISQFFRAGTEEKLLTAVDPDKWFFERYAVLKPGERLYWDNAKRFAARSGGRTKYIEQHMLKGVTKGDEKFKRYARMAFGSEERMKIILSMKANGEPRKDIPQHFSELSMDQLKEGLILQQGSQELRRIFGMYTFYDSSVRNQTILAQLDEMYGDEANKMALGMRLRKLGGDYIGAIEHEAEHKAKHHLEHFLKHTLAKYRPQANLEFLTNTLHPKTLEEFDHWKQAGMFDGLGNGVHINHPSELYHVINRRFHAINELLIREGQPVIDYSNPAGMNEQQRKIVNRVCETIDNTDPDKYLHMMQEISHYVEEDENVNELTEPYNRDIYMQTQFIDDARLQFLEKPQEAPARDDSHPAGIVINADSIRPLSLRFNQIGKGADDPLATAWSDAVQGFTVPQNIYKSFTSNGEANREAITNVVNAIKIMDGWKTDGAARMTLGAAYAKTWQTDFWHSAFYMSELPGASPGRKAINEHGPSLGLNEVHHYLIELSDDAHSNLELMNEHVFHVMEKFLGVTLTDENKEQILNKLPLYFYRGKLVVPMAVIILIGAAVVSGLSGLGAEVAPAHH